MITIVSNDCVKFQVHGRALLRDSKRFLLQEKYQDVEGTTITSSNAKTLACYVEYLNEGSIVLKKQYKRELSSLADYMSSVRFTHEVKWQLMYKDIMEIYLSAACEQDQFDKGPMSVIIDRVDLKDCTDTVLKTLSYHVLNMKLLHDRDIMEEMGHVIKRKVLMYMFYQYAEHLRQFVSNNCGFIATIKYEYIQSLSAFEAVYGPTDYLESLAKDNINDDNASQVISYMKNKSQQYEI